MNNYKDKCMDDCEDKQGMGRAAENRKGIPIGVPVRCLSLSQLSSINYAHGGKVIVSKKEHTGKRSIPLGVLTYVLMQIPPKGVKLETLNERCSDGSGGFDGKWLLEFLFPAGLVKQTKKGSGIYVVTDAARTAEYYAIPNESPDKIN